MPDHQGIEGAGRCLAEHRWNHERGRIGEQVDRVCRRVALLTDDERARLAAALEATARVAAA